MVICPKCKAEMHCVKTGVIVRWRESYCRAGDRFQCPKCGGEVVQCNRHAYSSTRPVAEDRLIQMED